MSEQEAVPRDYAEWPPPREGSRRRLAAIAAIVAGLAVSAVAGAYVGARLERGPASHTLLGEITIVRGEGILGGYQDGQPCSGAYGYNDLHTGAPVTVLNGSGATIASGTLNEGRFQLGSTPSQNTCTFAFTVQGVPNTAAYEVRAGSGRRSGPRYTRAELVQHHWRVDLTLGGSDSG